MPRRTVLIADDHALMAEGLAKLLSPEYDVVGTSSDGHNLVRDAERLRPDLICLDVGMPGLNGIQAAVKLHAALPRTKLVFVTQQIEMPYLRAAFQAGAAGYVAKQSAGSELLVALRRVSSGQSYITPLLSQHGHDPRDLMANPGRVFTDSLTSRQREVLQLIAEGKTVKEMSARLHISPKTVEFHKGGLMDELGLRTTAELTRYAIAHQIVSVE